MNGWDVFLCYRDQGSVHETELQPGLAMRAKQGRERGILRVPGILSEFRGSRRIEPRLRHRWDRLSVSLRDEQGRLRQGCQHHYGVPGEMRWVLEKFQKNNISSITRLPNPLSILATLLLLNSIIHPYIGIERANLRDLRNGFFFLRNSRSYLSRGRTWPDNPAILDVETNICRIEAKGWGRGGRG